MYAEMRSLSVLKRKELDAFLARGWFRMRQVMFTTHFLCFQDQFYSAVWLRAALANEVNDATFRQLKKRNSHFIVEVKKATFSQQHEALYGLYKQNITFQTSDSLQQLMYGHSDANIFHTYELNLYDGSTLVAAGYFDMGSNSAAGIVSFYHPAYRRYSLGKYIIYLKMEYCRQQGLQYFYPGYAVPGYPQFDYKLTINTASLQYFSLGQQAWLPLSGTIAHTPLQEMRQQLTGLQAVLQQAGIATLLLHYRYFDAGLDSYFSGYQLLGFPLFLQYTAASDNAGLWLMVYEVCSATFQLLQCRSLSAVDMYESSAGIFSTDLLVVYGIRHHATSALEMAALFSKK